MVDQYEERRLHLAKWGGYNTLPPNWQECPASDFWNQFMNYASTNEEYRQVKINGKTHGVRLYFYDDDQGLAMVENKDATHQHQVPLTFKFAACVHEFEAMPQRFNAYHESKCKKCGYVHVVDSSD